MAACSSKPAAQPSSACEAISSEEIATISGVQVGDGRPDDSGGESSCVWRAVPRPGEVTVLLGAAHSGSGFDERVADAVQSFGPATPVTIAGASKSVEFGDYGLVIMVVGDRLEQVQHVLGATASASVHRNLATSVAGHRS